MQGQVKYIFMVYTVDFIKSAESQIYNCKAYGVTCIGQIEKLTDRSENLIGRPVIVGFGPCGYWCLRAKVEWMMTDSHRAWQGHVRTC